MTIELRDMRWAVVIAQHRSLRQAAQTLNIRQSTLSRRLRDMEGQLGAELFERSNGGIRPTSAGVEFLSSARAILEDSDTAIKKFKLRSSGDMGRLAIGIYASLATGNMHAVLSEYSRRSPDVEIHIVDGSHDKLLCALTCNLIDIAIMTTCRSGWDDRMLPLWSERVIVALPEQHSLTAHEAVRWSDLANERILLPLQGPGLELERLLTSRLNGFPSQRILYHDSGLDRLLSLVSTGHGVLLMLEGGTGVRHDGIVYREIQDDGASSRLNFVAYWRQANLNPALEPFLKVVRERYPDLSSAHHA